ncbi:hypothetical protein PCIT_b0987 [Pseudoalteromonas citrea]|uniref:Uncharacterized protein n=1 Tax=Pseudoalteromonas citrea TaxID=43655 RepID=A0AAD4AFB1_9GAMM|nr:hypothetical protein PCIT_b0987 [Pseudoalteromonas citrea]
MIFRWPGLLVLLCRSSNDDGLWIVDIGTIVGEQAKQSWWIINALCIYKLTWF